LHAFAPLTTATVLRDPVIKVVLALKMKTAFWSPCASRVTVPVSPRVSPT